MSSPRIAAHLNAFGDRSAVIGDRDHELSYAQLAALVCDFANKLGTERVSETRDGEFSATEPGPVRRLVALAARNDIGSLVAYLGALEAGCAVLLTGSVSDEMLRVYDPDIVIESDDSAIEPGPDSLGIPEPRWRRTGSAHTLHPELALLLSTSGSTGSPKLVRLSYRNLLANAESIAEYLDIQETDRAATTLPLFYCYGLSVVHSYLLRGASLLMTSRSVLEPEFWDDFRTHRATSFAAVPYTFDLLERVGFERMSLPHLRYITQAGGKLSADQVRHHARAGERAGWRFYVMYGQTEATARMAYLPPRLATRHPDCIGIPVPGGSFSLEPVEEGGTELVYHGPNVMMGYAESPADLTLGPRLTELRTGDLACRTEDGLYKVIGRRSRFAKIFGLRIDLQRIESGLAAAGYSVCCTDDAETLVVAVAGEDSTAAAQLAAQLSGLPVSAVRVCTVAEIPRLPSGKPDYPTIRRLPVAPSAPSANVRTLFAEALGLATAAITPESTFADLGGDSLTYVALSVKLDRALGQLPANWQTMTVAELESLPRRKRRFGRSLDTTSLLRAIGIITVLGSHIGLFVLWGGAHVMLAVAGFNFARFGVTPAPAAQRFRKTLRTVALIAVPTALWVALTLPFSNYYRWQNVLLLNKILGPQNSPTAGHLWFVEVAVYFMLAGALLLRLPLADALERRAPFWFAMAVLAGALVFRYWSFDLYAPHDIPFSPLAVWFFVLGWAAAKARTVRQRALITAIALLTVPGYFGESSREHLVLAGLLLLIWVPSVRVPALVAGTTALLAEASLFAYLLHWQVYPLFGAHHMLALFASVAAGIAAAQLLAVARRFTSERISLRNRPVRRTRDSVLDGQDLGLRFMGQFRDQQIAWNRLAGKMIE
ncbi:AMP-binding protein [Nocardia sp. SYP-A9097]|uniref:AMP-binding protein n=1 Tax=Nocardia sp. SYP-A9097 TaxID=2663237 RepID=UPI00129AAD70|nr:AMP-binding protein [Nocardia sp. SYP-A9097]MRH88490.1 AMP-binding protein [Nocardia sp. SYP-A9097]